MGFIQKFTDVPYLFIYLFTVRFCDNKLMRIIQKFTDVSYLFIYPYTT